MNSFITDPVEITDPHRVAESYVVDFFNVFILRCGEIK